MSKLIMPKIRCYEGYRQHIESRFLKNGKLVNRWVFYVTGFSHDDSYALVLRSDGSEEIVSIDSEDRILINGKWYPRTFWNH